MTSFGLYEYQRMTFGVASAPGIFQRFMEELISGISGCTTYLDDILITGKNGIGHLENLKTVLSRLKRYGLICVREKCEFAAEEIEYLEHVISAKGKQPAKTRQEAVSKMPQPKNLKDVELL